MTLEAGKFLFDAGFFRVDQLMSMMINSSTNHIASSRYTAERMLGWCGHRMAAFRN